jgi:telomere length regulation protein
LQAERALDVAEKLVRASPDELRQVASDLARTLVQVRCSDLAVEGEEESAEDKRQRALVALLVTCPFESLDTLNKLLYSPNVDTSQRIMILDVMTDAAQELANAKTMKPKHQTGPLISSISESQPWFLPSSTGPSGAGSWKEISETGTLLNWSSRYERELPPKPSQIRRGKTRRWSLRSSNIRENQMQWSHNKFPVYAAAFMLPAMQGFDKKRHGVDLLGRDFIVLGKLIYMLGVCMKCAAMHPEASALAPPLLDLLRSR